MRDPNTEPTSLAREIVSPDSRRFVSNLSIAEQIESALAGCDIERLDYAGPARVVKRALAAHRGNPAAWHADPRFLGGRPAAASIAIPNSPLLYPKVASAPMILRLAI